MNESMNAATQNIHWLENSLLASEFAGKGMFKELCEGNEHRKNAVFEVRVHAQETHLQNRSGSYGI